MLLFSDVLYMLVRYASPSGPMCLRYLMFYCRLTCVVVSLFLSMYLCLTVLVKCLLYAFAICAGEVTCFLFESECCFWVALVFCWLIRVLSSKECV